MATIVTDLHCDLTQNVKPQFMHGNLFSQDNAANTINVHVFNDGEPATLGGSISANVIRSDGATVAVSGAIDGNKAYIILPQACYAVPGVIKIIVKNTENTTVTTIAAVVANVYASSTDTVVDPGTIIPSVAALIAQIEAAVDSIPVDYSGLLATIADTYSSSKTYKVGDYAWEAGVLKRCIVPITAGETFTAAHWTNAVIGDDLSALKSALEHTVTLHPVWERGNINNSGNNANSSRYVRSASPIKVNSDTIHIEFDGSYSSDPIYTVFLYNGNTFSQRINKTASADISITPGMNVRFLISTGGQDTQTEISVDNSDDYLVATAVEFFDVEPDKTLTLSDRPADSKTVGDKLSEMCKKIVQMEWTRGNISTSSGTNASSSATNRIRTAYKYQINEDKLHLSVPTGMKVGLYKYTQIYGVNFDSYVDAFSGEADVSVTPGTFIRLTAYKADDSDLSPSAGDAVIVSVSTDVQTFYDEYNAQKLTDYSCLSMFETVGIIGDSWASGSIHFPDGSYSETYYNMSWGQILARKIGFTATNFSKGGLSTKTWLADATYGLSALLADEPKNLYIINLGINDNTQIEAGTLDLGTIDDVNVSDYTQNPDTFFGDYGRIIGNIKNHAPKAIIVAVSVLRPGERNMDAYIKQIAEKYEIPYIQASDDEYFMSGYFFRSIYGGHMSAFGYSAIANAVERLLQKYIVENPLMFGYYDGTTE